MQDTPTPFSSSEIIVNDDALRGWPLPMPGDDADKEERGRILVGGGSREMPGGVIPAAEAALRAGAGKLAIATGASVAQLVALAIPESRVIGLPEMAAGGLAASGANEIAELASRADAVLVGPGMQDEAAACDFLLELLPRLGQARLVLDACALGARGAPLEQAGVWGVARHARAGEQLAARMGPRGYLAREIAQQVPALMHGLRPPACCAEWRQAG